VIGNADLAVEHPYVGAIPVDVHRKPGPLYDSCEERRLYLEMLHALFLDVEHDGTGLMQYRSRTRTFFFG
jgi:hypothetical protein